MIILHLLLLRFHFLSPDPCILTYTTVVLFDISEPRSKILCTASLLFHNAAVFLIYSCTLRDIYGLALRYNSPALI